MITQITTHEADAIKRLLAQYRAKPRMEGLAGTFGAQAQSLEDVLFALLSTARSIYTAEGEQLDQIGAIVGLDRSLGFDDETYRVLLFAKIGLNVSQGETERVIDVYRLVTAATHVDLQEYQPAAVGLFSNGDIAPSLINTIWHFVSDVVSAGVRVDHFGHFDETNGFSFIGSGDGGGFGDTGDASAGGLFGELFLPSVPLFALAGDDHDRDAAGLGDLKDPPTGGQLNTL